MWPQGTASYYTVKIGGEVIPDAAWYYPEAKAGKAKEIEGFVAFYKVRFQVLFTSLTAYFCARVQRRWTDQGPVCAQNKVKIHE